MTTQHWIDSNFPIRHDFGYGSGFCSSGGDRYGAGYGYGRRYDPSNDDSFGYVDCSGFGFGDCFDADNPTAHFLGKTEDTDYEYT